MKSGLLLFVFLTSLICYGQIVNKDIKKTYQTRYYFETQRMEMFRTLEPNNDFLPWALSERADEIPINIWSQQVGICIGLGPHLYLDAGMAWMQNGEAYVYQDSQSDSSFNYQTHYRYIGLPFEFKSTFGDKIQFYLGTGLAPALYNGFKQDIQWTNSLGAQYDDKIVINNTLSSFILLWKSSCGLDIHLDDFYNLRLGLIYRQQLNNSYGPYEHFVHKSKGWGINLGLSKKL